MRQYNITVEHEDGSATQYLNVPELDIPLVLRSATPETDVTGYSVRVATSTPRQPRQPLVARRVLLEPGGSTFVPDVVVLLVLAYAHVCREARDQFGGGWFVADDVFIWLRRSPVVVEVLGGDEALSEALPSYLTAMARTGLLLAPSGDLGWRLP